MRISLENFFLPAPGELILARQASDLPWYPAKYVKMRGMDFSIIVNWIDEQSTHSTLAATNVQFWRYIYRKQDDNLAVQDNPKQYERVWRRLPNESKCWPQYKENTSRIEEIPLIWNFMNAWLTECKAFDTHNRLECILRHYFMELDELLNMPGYSDVIKEPISFLDILRKVQRPGGYQDAEIQLLSRDVKLMFANALKYHTDSPMKDISEDVLACTLDAQSKFDQVWNKVVRRGITSNASRTKAPRLNAIIHPYSSTTLTGLRPVHPVQIRPTRPLNGYLPQTPPDSTTSSPPVSSPSLPTELPLGQITPSETIEDLVQVVTPPQKPRPRRIRVLSRQELADYWWSPDLFP